MKIAEAFVELRVDRKAAEREAKGAATGALDAMRNVFAAGVVIAGLNKSVQDASDLNETISKTKVVFGDAQRSIEEWSKSSAQQLGISQRAALDAAAQFAIFGQAAGLAGEDLTGFSTDLTGLAADLASFNNTTPEQAIEAIGAALRGESEPIRAYGVLLDDATLKAKAMELGLYDGVGALEQSARVLAAQKAILEQTGQAQGDFARTADGVANSQRILAAEAENASASFGEVLLPVYDKALEVVTFLVTAFGELPGPAQTAVVALAGLVAFSGPLGTIKDTIVDLTSAFVNIAGSSARAAIALGVAGGVIAAAAGLYITYTADKRKAEAATREFAEALRAEAAGQKGAVNALIARKLVDSDALAISEQLGLSTADLGRVVRGETVPAFEAQRTAIENVLRTTGSWDLKNQQLRDTLGVTAVAGQNFLLEVDRLSAAYSSGVEAADDLTEAEEALAGAHGRGIDGAEGRTETTAALTRVTSGAVDSTEDLTDATDGAAKAQAEARERFRDATKAAEEQRQAIEDLYDALLGVVDAQRNYERALDDSESAVLDFDEVMSDSESTLEDIDDAARNAADSIIDTAKAYAEAEGASLNSSRGIGLMIESLYTQAAALDPSSPLRARLLEYIAELQKIPANIDTNIRLRVTGQTVTRDGDVIGIRALPGSAVASAEGRYVPAGANLLSTFGEQGPEAILPLDKPNRLVELLGDPRVGGPVAAAMGSGTSTTTMSAPSVRVYIGERELTDIVDVRIDRWGDEQADRITRGRSR
jgi:hypothetical protein